MGLTKTISFDVDAQRFIFASGITNFNQKRAVDYLAKGLKVNGLWAKMTAVYPMVGGTAFTCKFNLVNPRDSDLAYRLTFTASPTFSLKGVDWNGTTQFADTKIIPSTNTVMLQNSSHLSYYCRDNDTAAGIDMGCNVAGVDRCYAAVTGAAFSINTSSAADAFTNTSVQGLFIASRTASNLTTAYMNGANIFSTVTASTGKPTISIYLACRNIGGVGSNFCTRQFAFASIGSGLSAADAFNMYNIVQQFQIIINRAV